jgi:16S rRNA processing protein RimM
MENTISIGHTKKPHGLKGEIKLAIEERYIEDLMLTEIILLEIRGKKTPFFIEDVRVGNNIIAKFEDIDTPELALSISSKEIFLRATDLLADDEREMIMEKMPFEHCIGYTIYDGDKTIGVIEIIEEFPQQEMAILQYENREILVPLNEQFIVRVDDEGKAIYMNLPEGILDL